MKAELYTKPSCSYCVKAKELLNERQIPYTEKVIGQDATKEELLSILPNAKTVPQIWVDKKHIGGYTDLYELLHSSID